MEGRLRLWANGVFSVHVKVKGAANILLEINPRQGCRFALGEKSRWADMSVVSISDPKYGRTGIRSVTTASRPLGGLLTSWSQQGETGAVSVGSTLVDPSNIVYWQSLASGNNDAMSQSDQSFRNLAASGYIASSTVASNYVNGTLIYNPNTPSPLTGNAAYAAAFLYGNWSEDVTTPDGSIFSESTTTYADFSGNLVSTYQSYTYNSDTGESSTSFSQTVTDPQTGAVISQSNGSSSTSSDGSSSYQFSASDSTGYSMSASGHTSADGSGSGSSTSSDPASGTSSQSSWAKDSSGNSSNTTITTNSDGSSTIVTTTTDSSGNGTQQTTVVDANGNTVSDETKPVTANEPNDDGTGTDEGPASPTPRASSFLSQVGATNPAKGGGGGGDDWNEGPQSNLRVSRAFQSVIDSSSSTSGNTGWGDSSSGESPTEPTLDRSINLAQPPTAVDDWGSIDNPHALGALIAMLRDVERAMNGATDAHATSISQACVRQAGVVETHLLKVREFTATGRE